MIQVFKCWYKSQQESFILINVFSLFVPYVQQLLLIIYLPRGIIVVLLLSTLSSFGCAIT